MANASRGDMTLFEFYKSLREDILAIITGVKNAGGGWHWDDTTPNWTTKNKLEKLYWNYISSAKNFGVLVVTRHCDCQNPRHFEYPTDYPTSNVYGIDILYEDKNYIWNGGQLYQGRRLCVCSCSPNNLASDHHVIDDVIYSSEEDIEKLKNFEYIFSDIHRAIVCSSDNKSRSSIREYLLRTVIRINDELLPTTMNDYIENIMLKI